MKSERKYFKVIKCLSPFFYLFIVCFSFTSCITINHVQEPQRISSFIDPVCGIKVDTTTALKTDFKGRMYYFDSEECQKVFLKNPEKFTVDRTYNSHNMSNMGWMAGTAMITVMLFAMTTMVIFGHGRW